KLSAHLSSLPFYLLSCVSFPLLIPILIRSTYFTLTVNTFPLFVHYSLWTHILSKLMTLTRLKLFSVLDDLLPYLFCIHLVCSPFSIHLVLLLKPFPSSS